MSGKPFWRFDFEPTSLKVAIIYGALAGALLVYFVASFPVGVIPVVYERY